MSNVSNLILFDGQTLMDLALSELNKRSDKLEKKGWKGTFEFKFRHNHMFVKNVHEIYTITVKFENKGWGKYMGIMKQKFLNHYVIIINNSSQNKETMFNTYVHEVTHVSQKFNGFLEHSHNEEAKRYQRDIVAKRKKSKVNIKKYYNNRHNENLAEHEAELVSFLQLLKENKVGSAYEFAIKSPSYFQFEFKDFVKKAYSYGVQKDAIIAIQQMIKPYLDNIVEVTYKTRFLPLRRFFNL